jgi:hypothetical protein
MNTIGYQERERERERRGRGKGGRITWKNDIHIYL